MGITFVFTDNTTSRWGMFLRTGVLAVTATLGGCQSTAPVPPTRVSGPPVHRELNTAARRVVEQLDRRGGPMDISSSAILLARQRLRATYDGPKRVQPQVVDDEPGRLQHVQITVRGAAIDDVMRILIGQYLQRSYMLSPNLKASQSVTLDIDEQMTDRDIVDLIGALAILHGWTIQEQGDVFVIDSAKNMARSSVTPLLQAHAAMPSERTGVRVFKLNHLDAASASDAIKELISEGAKTIVSGRTLLVVDRIRQLNRLGELLDSLDVPAFQDVEIWTYQLVYQDPDYTAKILSAISQASNLSTSADSLVSFIPIPHVDSLMVITPDPTVQPLIRQWVVQIDQPPNVSYRHRYLYRIQNYDPPKLLALLRSVFSHQLEHDKEDPTDPGVRFVLDTEEDLLVIFSQPQDYADILAVLQRVDVPRQQVMLQSIIAEVVLNDALAYGVEYFLQGQADGNPFGLTGDLAQLALETVGVPTGSAFITATDGFAIINALEEESEVTILSAPTLLVRDKDQAKIQVGGEEPVITSSIDSSTQSNGNTGIRQEIEYRDTGVILEIQPRINESGDVTLLIKQQIRDVLAASSSSIESPAFTLREIDTTVVIPHGRTLLLGGIINTRSEDRVERIPILGHLPLIGHAFSNSSEKTDRTELVLAITPTVFNTPQDASPAALSDFLVGTGHVADALRQFGIGLTPDDVPNPESSKPVDPQPSNLPLAPTQPESITEQDVGTKSPEQGLSQ